MDNIFCIYFIDILSIWDVNGKPLRSTGPLLSFSGSAAAARATGAGRSPDTRETRGETAGGDRNGVGECQWEMGDL